MIQICFMAAVSIPIDKGLVQTKQKQIDNSMYYLWYVWDVL